VRHHSSAISGHLDLAVGSGEGYHIGRVYANAV